jgi:hypothetical protein
MPRRYSVRELTLVIVVGIFAFVVTGYLGYHSQPALIRQLFDPPAFLFLWFCYILLLIMRRHPTLQGRALAPVGVFLFSVFLVALYYLDRTYFGSAIATAVSQLLKHLVPALTGGRFIPNLLNFGVLLWYAFTVLSSWWRRYGPGTRTASTARAADESLPGRPARLDLENAIHGELISGDLIAGAAIASFFALIFWQPVFTTLQSLAPVPPSSSPPIASRGGTASPVTYPPCPITLPIGQCPPQNSLHHPAYITLTFVDVRVAFALAAAGGLVLVIVSAIRTFREVAIERFFVEFLRTLLSALGRFLALRFLDLVKVLWLPAILFAPVAAVRATQYVQCNLHWLGGDQLAPSCRVPDPVSLNVLLAVVAAILLAVVLSAVTLVPRRLGGVPLQVLRQSSGLLVFVLVLTVALDFAPTRFGGITSDDRYVLLAVAWLLIAMLALIWGLGLWLGRWDVIAQSLIFLAFFSWIVAISFWVFSLVLTGADSLLVSLFASSKSRPHPFQLTDTTWFSLVAFGATAVYAVVRYGVPLRQRTERRAA